MIKYSTLMFTLVAFMAHAQEPVLNFNEDKKAVRAIYDEALVNGQSYENLRELCKTIGGRLSGSPQAEKAVLWGKQKLEALGLDRVYLQEVEVPHWVRGDKESCKVNFIEKDKELNICALGGSISTNGLIKAEVIEVKDFKELEAIGKENIAGKIVFYNQPMDPRHISTFNAYGACVDYRYDGAAEAAKYGAIASITRAMSLLDDHHPHTGSMGYVDSIPKIPAAAISTRDADELSKILRKERGATLSMQMNCQSLPNTISYNVIGEIKGSVEPDKIILVGGHLDSWDNGEGAHDDGAGCVQSIEALRMLKKLGYKPRYTLRAVLYMNEENGNKGGKTYAKNAKEKGEKHLAAIESDRGGFSPRGFSIDAADEKVEAVKKWRGLLEPYGLHFFEKGYGGVDIGPLKDGKVTLIGLVPDSQRYFDYHHAATDVFENVNRRELELGGASMAALIFLIDKYWSY